MKVEHRNVSARGVFKAEIPEFLEILEEFAPQKIPLQIKIQEDYVAQGKDYVTVGRCWQYSRSARIAATRRNNNWKVTLVHELTHVGQAENGVRIQACSFTSRNPISLRRLKYLSRLSEIEAYHIQAKYMRRLGLNPLTDPSILDYSTYFNFDVENLKEFK